jgi:E3 ubiquitin-protein ligase CCNP1IP1
MGLASLQNGRTASAPLAQHRGTPARQPLTSLSPNGASNYAFAGYGMSAGVKVSHPVAAAQSNILGARPTVRSRGWIIL